MNITVNFQVRHTYEVPVSFSPHRYRLLPRSGFSGVLRKTTFTTNANARVTNERDIFDNETVVCFYPDAASTLLTDLRLELELTPRDPFAFTLAPHALTFPFLYHPREHQLLNMYLEASGPTLPIWRLPTTPAPTVESIMSLNQSFREHLAYERRDEGVARSPLETLAQGRGACRDFSVLLAAVLRKFGVASRLVSGYLVESAGEEHVAEGAFHAWTEAYLPGAGWIGLDPTNGTLCDHRHIPVAIGLEPDDIAPSTGSYYHDKLVKNEMVFQVNVAAID